MIYTPLHTYQETLDAISKDWDASMKMVEANAAKLSEIDAAAKEKGEYLFRSFKRPMGDGYAIYQITAIKGANCTVTHCEAVALDEWVDSMLGYEANIGTEIATGLIDSQDAMAKLFS